MEAIDGMSGKRHRSNQERERDGCRVKERERRRRLCWSDFSFVRDFLFVFGAVASRLLKILVSGIVSGVRYQVLGVR